MSQELNLPATPGMMEDWVRDEDGRDRISIKTVSAFKVEDVIKPWKDVLEFLTAGCGCSDDLSMICGPHTVLM